MKIFNLSEWSAQNCETVLKSSGGDFFSNQSHDITEREQLLLVDK